MLSPDLRSILKGVSRSFYLSVRVLPSTVQEQVAVGYLLARAADSLADTAILPAAERRRLLGLLRLAATGERAAHSQFLSALAAAQARTPLTGDANEGLLLQRLGDCLALLGDQPAADRALLQRVLDQLTSGMERDLERFPPADGPVPPGEVVGLADRSQLDEYTYSAAGCVGEFWTDLMALHLPALSHLAGPDLRRRGISLGNALQLVNVIRDVRADLQIGRCYWPEDLLRRHQLSPARLAEIAALGPGSPSVATAEATALQAATAELCDWSLDLCRAAWPYVQAIPAAHIRVRLACIWPLLLAVDTLRALRAAGSPLLCWGPPIKISRQQVYGLLWESTGAAVRDRFLGGGRIDRVFSLHAGLGGAV